MMPAMNPEGIYINKNMRLNNLQVYGFDYDYTLAHYSASLQRLIYDLAKEHLLRYPESYLKFEYDPAFPIRGLYYDKFKGLLMKLDFFGSIEPDCCYFGCRKRVRVGLTFSLSEKLRREELIEIYGTRHIGRDQARGLVSLMDVFCFSEACLIADIVQHFVDEQLEFDSSYVYQDVNHAIQHVHRSGLVHREILSNPPKYLVKNCTVLTLVCTSFDLITGILWVVETLGGNCLMLSSQKPISQTFISQTVHSDAMKWIRTDWLLQRSMCSFRTKCITMVISSDNSGMVLSLYKRSLNSCQVIYYGDRLFSDLRGPSKAGWCTAAIICELENEIQIQNKDSYRFEQAKLHIVQELLGKLHGSVTTSQKS
ncbi:5'-nucleotidase domain-containing protein [Drosera capensis]